jgi:hypothetical protein
MRDDAYGKCRIDDRSLLDELRRDATNEEALARFTDQPLSKTAVVENADAFHGGRSKRGRTPARIGGRNSEDDGGGDELCNFGGRHEHPPSLRRMCRRRCARRKRQTKTARVGRFVDRQFIAVAMRDRGNQPHAQRQREHGDASAPSCMGHVQKGITARGHAHECYSGLDHFQRSLRDGKTPPAEGRMGNPERRAYNPARLPPQGLRSVTSRRLKLLALLLPLFVARSLLPIGFMLSFDTGSLRIVFCPSVISTAGPSGAQDPAAHAHHDHAAHHAHHHSSDADSSATDKNHQSCPFAFAAAAPLAQIDHFALVPRTIEAFAEPAEATFVAPLSGAHPIRGPPAFS